MKSRWRWIRGAMLVVLLAGLAMTDAVAKGAKRGHSSGHAAKAPHYSAPRRAPKVQAPKAPRMAHAATPARANTAHQFQPRTNSAQAHANTNVKAKTNHPTASAATSGTSAHRATVGTVNPANTSLTSNSPGIYTYGTGRRARSYRAYGYGHGYRNRYYGSGYGYGRSQRYNRAIVSRLRSVYSSLARLNHDYRGHRVRAMHAVALAIRQLTHRSMIYSGVGFAPGGNHGLAMGTQQGGVGVGVRDAVLRTQPLTQAQSDARMSKALRTLQGINLQLSSQGYSTTGQARARGHVHRAIHELKAALAIT